MKPQDKYVLLFPLLDGYWEKPLSELPEALRARVSNRVNRVSGGFQPKLDANGKFVSKVELHEGKKVDVYPVWEEIYIENEVGDYIPGFRWDEMSPERRRQFVKNIDDKNDPALAGERHIDWHDASMDARRWWDMQNVTPKEAAMVLCRLNPFEREDPERIYVDGDESSPHIYQLLLRVFEGVASTSPKPRMLMEWRTIAQQHNLRYHSWIDDYADAMEAFAGKQAAPIATAYTNSKASVEPPGITDGMVTITKLAITAAWEIKREIKRDATAKEVIERLQEWVTIKRYAELVEIMPRGVKWVTARKVKPYDIEACMTTLKSWRKRLQQNPA